MEFIFDFGGMETDNGGEGGGFFIKGGGLIKKKGLCFWELIRLLCIHEHRDGLGSIYQTGPFQDS